MNYKISLKISTFIFFTILILNSCKISYSFSGASIAPTVKSFSVENFANRAPIFNPSLATELTNGLIDKIQGQSRLKMVSKDGDVHFEGEITNYYYEPIAIQGNDLAAQNRLTITIKVIYTNEQDPKQSFESNFSRFANFDANKSLNEVEAELSKDIIDQLTEDIFNKAFVNW